MKSKTITQSTLQNRKENPDYI